jgi:hypothetical protein
LELLIYSVTFPWSFRAWILTICRNKFSENVPFEPMRATAAPPNPMNTFDQYRAKLKRAEAATKLPLPGVLLYTAMSRLVGMRWLQPAKIIGQILQRLFSTNVAVNNSLANVYSQLWNPVDECKALMRIAIVNCHDHELLARAGESAAYARDASSLVKLMEIATEESPPLLAYLSGLLAFLNGQANYQAYFKESVESYLRIEDVGLFDEPGKSVGILTMKLKESGRNLPGFFRQAYNIRELADLDELLMADSLSTTSPSLSGVLDRKPDTGTSPPDVIVLISCSEGYLRAFADYYIRTFLRRNSNIIHFHVIAEDVEAARDYLGSLRKKYFNIRYSIEPLAGRSQTYITLSRFLLCHDVMNHYNCDVLISDIDLQIDFDLSSLGSELKSKSFDFGLCDMGYSVPWAKFAAGFCYFRVANIATDVYLRMLSRHLASLHAEGGYFSMDMTGVSLIHEYMQARGYAFRVFNLYSAIDFIKLISVPRRLQRQKIKIKWGSGGPQ